MPGSEFEKRTSCVGWRLIGRSNLLTIRARLVMSGLSKHNVAAPAQGIGSGRWKSDDCWAVSEVGASLMEAL